jgi:hypothetical protein
LILIAGGWTSNATDPDAGVAVSAMKQRSTARRNSAVATEQKNASAGAAAEALWRFRRIGWSGDRGHGHSNDETNLWLPVFRRGATFSILQKLLRLFVAAITAA